MRYKRVSRMPVNLNKPQEWKADIAASVDMYNEWFLLFAPKAFREARIRTTKEVEDVLVITKNLKKISSGILQKNPEILPTLRISNCPPIAVDRLFGLAGVPSSFVKSMELYKKLPARTLSDNAVVILEKIATVISFETMAAE